MGTRHIRTRIYGQQPAPRPVSTESVSLIGTLRPVLQEMWESAATLVVIDEEPYVLLFLPEI